METHHSSPSTAGRPLAPQVAPVINVSSPASGLAGTTVTLTGSGFTGVTAVTFGGVPATSFTVVSSTRITAVAPAGSGTVQIVVTTTGGTSNGIGFTYTTATPVISTVAPSQGPVAGGNTVTLTGSAFGGATTVRFGAAPAAFALVSPTQVTATAPAGAAGAVNVTITTPGGTSAGVPYTYVSAPALSAVAPSQGPLSGGNSVILSGTDLTGAGAVGFGSSPSTSFTVLSATQITAVPPAAAAGAVAVTVTTPGGTTLGDVFYYYLAPPALTGGSPGAGPTAGGTTVTLTGSNLLAATAVRFGATAATFTIVSAVQINAVAPAAPAGSVAVTVVTPGGTSNAVAYAYLAAPALATVTPNQGAASGGTTVTLTGTNLTGATSVLFGTVSAAFTVVSDSHLTATVPPGAAGTVSVTVATPGGTTAGVPYTRLAPPGI
ncbi:IPT/TIG domain-containing protein [Streptomyces sp.]|uniref:IPT/TIG domain-containing protein n=1 Tax=Streptomyces sp. TaxID=1931 RepID=UPI002F40C7F8